MIITMATTSGQWTLSNECYLVTLTLFLSLSYQLFRQPIHVVVGCGATGFFTAVMNVCRLVRGTEKARTNSKEEERED